ncbi:MAG: DUF1735 domain-containing protein [Muribaculaceae bacterium]|nr:DUF1735 domain-containing protein [Muribaculaceae bacterium]
MNKSVIILAVLGTAMTGCHNSDIEFDNFDYQTIYFAKQSPVRTITLGDDGEFDTRDDNAHRFYIKATLGGVNVNNSTHSAAFVIDNSLCDKVVFENGSNIMAMPGEYYTINGDEMTITPGNVIGGVEVQLSDAFFNDPLSTGVNYVIPLRLTHSADSILQGKAKDGIENPDRLNPDDWATQPKDYVFYAVCFKNPYHGCWLSKGTDVIENNGAIRTDDRTGVIWEKATLRYLTTRSLTQSVYNFTTTVSTIDAGGGKDEKTLVCDLILDIDADGACTVSTDTPGCTASGSGQWTRQGEPKAWGDKDRDLLELSYEFTVDYVYNEQTGQHVTYRYKSNERMVMQSRQNRLQEFKFTLK